MSDSKGDAGTAKKAGSLNKKQNVILRIMGFKNKKEKAKQAAASATNNQTPPPTQWKPSTAPGDRATPGTTIGAKIPPQKPNLREAGRFPIPDNTTTPSSNSSATSQKPDLRKAGRVRVPGNTTPPSSSTSATSTPNSSTVTTSSISSPQPPPALPISVSASTAKSSSSSASSGADGSAMVSDAPKTPAFAVQATATATPSTAHPPHDATRPPQHEVGFVDATTPEAIETRKRVVEGYMALPPLQDKMNEVRHQVLSAAPKVPPDQALAALKNAFDDMNKNIRTAIKILKGSSEAGLVKSGQNFEAMYAELEQGPAVRDTAEATLAAGNESYEKLKQLLKTTIDTIKLMTAEKADTLCDQAAVTAPKVLADLQRLQEAIGFQFIGLEFMVKTKDSLQGKLSGDMVEGGKSLDQAAEDVADAVRFTACFAAEDLVEGVRTVLNGQIARNYVVYSFKNTWRDPNCSYKGINVKVKTPEGQSMEIQFHTPASFWLKDMGTHDLYEEKRKPDCTKERKQKIDETQFKMVEVLAAIPGILDLTAEEFKVKK